ncbi:MAG: glycosyltransferase family 39 protein [Planctomycetota bacterium]|nr:glycosyltransferase family 39 protein [Planctomycetota bacterium]
MATTAASDLPDGGRAPSWRDRDVLFVCLLALVLQLFTLHMISGYQLADSVEYMDRAARVADGERLQPGTVRSFAFSALLTPIFAVADWIGVADDRPAVLFVRLMQMALGLIAVLVTVRVGARLFGRGPGLAAGVVLGTNPIFLQWSVEPLSGTAAMLCTVLALQSMLEPPSFRRGLVTGAWLGAGLLMAFQTILVIASFLGLLLLRDRWRGRRHYAGMLCTITLLVIVQCFLDLLVYGEFGSSLANYLVQNVASTLVGWLVEIADVTGIKAFREVGVWIYERAFEITDRAWAESGEVMHMKSRTWYLENLPSQALVWPLLFVTLLGIARVVRRPRWPLSILLLTLVASVAVMAMKGSQSYRLWLPLLPLIAVLAGGGWGWIRGSMDRGGGGHAGKAGEAGLLRRLAAGAVLLAGLVMGTGILRAANLEKYGGYWAAIQHVNEAADRSVATGGERLVVSSGYHWAVRFRESANVELVKLPHPLYAWDRLEPEEQAAVLERLEGLDWFISHLQLIEQDLRIMEVVNRRFEIARLIYAPETFEELLPIHLLRRRTGDPDARTFFDIVEGVEPDAYRTGLQSAHSIDFRRRYDDDGDGVHDDVRQMVLLGWDIDTDPSFGGGTMAWLTMHWWAGPLAGHDFTTVYRISDPDDRSRQLNHAPTYGVHPTSTWQEGWIVRESLGIELSRGPGDFGGAFCRGDAIPARLFLALPEYAEVDGVLRNVGGLTPFRPSGANPIHKERIGGAMVSEDGYVFSADNLFLAGGFLLPVPSQARLPDDGRPFLE